MEDKVLIDWDELKTLRFAAGLLEQVANERDALRLEVKRLQADSAELAKLRGSVEPVAFHMIEGQKIFDLIATNRISRRVDGAHLGPMGAVEVTLWNTKIGMELEQRCSMGGMSVYLRAIAQAGQVPEGFALVPVEPTPAMLKATENIEIGASDWRGDKEIIEAYEAREVYLAMIAAAQGDSHE